MDNHPQTRASHRTDGVPRRRHHTLRHLDPAFVVELSGRLPAHTAECIQDTFGISANTWLKLRKGMPIRQSVAERLLNRFGAQLRHS
ncbi:MAG: hypothetical protein J7498_04475 [Sphingobium sp.]|nr:hypothetical protein [Sphingobium sp.]